MDETIADTATAEEWKRSFEQAETLYGGNFPAMLESAEAALAKIKGDDKLTQVVDTQTTKMLQEYQMKILMLRAAAYKAIPK